MTKKKLIILLCIIMFVYFCFTISLVSILDFFSLSKEDLFKIQIQMKNTRPYWWIT